MSKLKKSLKATADNVKKSGTFAIYPYKKWSDGLLQSLEIKGARLGNKHLWFTLNFFSYQLSLFVGSTIAQGVTVPLGSVGLTVSVIAGLIHGSYSAVNDLVNFFTKEDIFHEERSLNETITSHELIMETFTKVSSLTSSEHYMSYTQSYSEEVRYGELNSVKIDRLNLTTEEWALFENCLDPITNKLINIPVMLNGQSYDLNTLLPLLNTTGLDPIKQIPFLNRDIIFDTKMVLEIDKTIQFIKENRLQTRPRQGQGEQPQAFEELRTQTLQSI